MLLAGDAIAESSDDPDDTFLEATELSFVGRRANVGFQDISEGSDVDLYGFEADAGDTFGFDLDPTSSLIGSLRLRLFDSIGVELATETENQAPDEVFGTEASFGYFEHTFSTAGTFFIGVSDAENDLYDSTSGSGDSTSGFGGAYTLTVTDRFVRLGSGGRFYPTTVEFVGNDDAANIDNMQIDFGVANSVNPSPHIDFRLNGVEVDINIAAIESSLPVTVLGQAGRDVVVVRQISNAGFGRLFDLVVETGSGNDVVQIGSTNNSLDDVVPGNVVVNTGSGTDEVLVVDTLQIATAFDVSDGSSGLVLRKINSAAGTVTVQGATGDKLRLSTSGSAAPTVRVFSLGTVSDNARVGFELSSPDNAFVQIGGGDLDTIRAPITLDSFGLFDRVTLVDFVGGGGNDFSINATTGDAVITRGGPSFGGVTLLKPARTLNISAGTGDNNLFVQGDLDLIAEELSFDGGSGNDVLIVDDDASTVGRDYSIVGGVLSRSGGVLSRVDPFDVEQITLFATDFNDSFRLASKQASLDVDIYGEDGNDVFDVSFDSGGNSIGRLDSFAGNTTVRGGLGSDQVLLDDNNDLGGDDAYRFDRSTEPNFLSLTKPGNTGGFESFAIQNVDDISLVTNNANNAVDILATQNNATIRVDTAIGDDTITVGDGDLALNLRNVDIDGGIGTDTLHVDDRIGTVGFDGWDFFADRIVRDPARGQTTFYQEIESTTVTAGDRGESFRLHAFTGPLKLDLGGGNDDASLTPVERDLDALTGLVSLLGGAGNDSLVVDDTSDGGFDDYVLTAATLRKPGASNGIFPGLDFESFSSLLFEASNGFNDIDILSTAAGTEVTVDANNGADELTVGGGDLDSNILGPLILRGGADSFDNPIIFDDSLDGFDANSADVLVFNSRLSQDRLVKGSGPEIQFSGDRNLILGSPQPTLYDIDGTSFDITEIVAGNADDTFRLSPTTRRLDDIRQAVVLRGNGGFDTLIADDSISTSARDLTLNVDPGSAQSGSLRTSPSTGTTTLASFDGIDAFDITTGSGANTILVTGEPGVTTIRTGAGSDVIDIEGQRPGELFTIDAGPGDDVLRLNDDEVGTTRVALPGSQTFSDLQLFAGATLEIAPGVQSLVDVSNTFGLPNIGSSAPLLDLSDSTLILRDRAPGDDTFFQTRIEQAYAGGTWLGTQGLTSSVSRDSSLADGIGYGYANTLGLSTISGTSLNSNDFVLSYALLGDADLSGSVDLADFGRLRSGFGQASFWASGDFTYDATTQLDDFGLLRANFGLSSSSARSASTLFDRDDDA
ncbi:MAG: hypothetical protein AAGI46_08415 [Planctomycetota bacterium]